MSRCITIYTDASVHFETKTGGWACWIKYGQGKAALYAGAFKKPVARVDCAELMAIANGLAAAKTLNVQGSSLIVVVTDSASSMRYIEYARARGTHLPGPKRKKLDKEYFDLAKAILAAVPEGHELRVNKVKAHSKNDGKRSYVNDLVDKAARGAMRAARKERAA